MGKNPYTRIDVTQADIDRALRKKSGKCVLATAIARSIEGAGRVDVDLQTIRFTVGGERRVYLTPPAASGYVIAFDAEDELHPFAFRLSENHRVNVRQDKATPAAKERRRAKSAISAAERKAARAAARRDAIRAEPDPDPDELALAEAQRRKAARDINKAKANETETAERLAGEPWAERDTTPHPGTGGRPPRAPARAFRNSTREYGARVLRVNSDPPTPENRAARDSIMAVYNESRST